MYLYRDFKVKKKLLRKNKLFYVWLSGIYECVMTGAIAYSQYVAFLKCR